MTSSTRARTARRAAAKERARRGSKRQRTPIGLVAVAAVLLVVVAMVVIATIRKPGTTEGASPAGAVARSVQAVPVEALDSVAAGSGVTAPTPLPSGTPPLEAAGKPEIVYVGAEYCPYCAAQRWPLIVALSRFGTFTNLGATESAADDIFPLTQTFTFHGSTYSSDYLAFTAVETNTNQLNADGIGYQSLEQLTAEQQGLLAIFDQPPYASQPGAIPFLMIGNRFVSVGSSFDPGLLQGMSREQIAAALSDPSSPVAQSIDGSANAITAAICQLTGGQPDGVCSDPVITRLMSAQPASP